MMKQSIHVKSALSHLTFFFSATFLHTPSSTHLFLPLAQLSPSNLNFVPFISLSSPPIDPINSSGCDTSDTIPTCPQQEAVCAGTDIASTE
ncbi:hypothetical protein BLNAU_14626 [Blattamonas nauphoetae]|uniref:Uncharacterized protein n=1 Tax=Blattamonas nauphoetae TaxID=2049346 RepID=A0ABQ9XGN4_9EUKA|nr:hypothetical protein BLNAU_14626 [Blattamonas nauphoetae]